MTEERRKLRDEIHLTANHLAEDILDKLEATERELRLARYLLRRWRDLGDLLRVSLEGDATEAYLLPDTATEREQEALEQVRRKLGMEEANRG